MSRGACWRRRRGDVVKPPLKPLWLLGEDIARSPSPAMHNAALVALGEAPVYALHPCTREEAPAAFEEAERTCRGVNVTAPHKLEAARRYAGVLDEDARLVGAVNTVVYDGGRATAARNTDVGGLLFSWRRAALHVEGRTVGLIGAGGAARAVVVAAQRAGARGIVVHARRLEAAAPLVALAGTLGLDAMAADSACGASIAVVAATELDDPPSWIARALEKPGAVHDLRYGPRTRAVRDASLRAGHLYSDGTMMLLGQAQEALAAFLGRPLTEAAGTAMRQALARTVSR